MAESTATKQTHALISLYVKIWTKKYGEAPNINRYRERWGFQAMIDDLGYDRSREVVEYYFNTPRIGHPVKYLLLNYDRLDTIMKEIAEDELRRKELRRKTEERVRKWEELGYN
jgi:hypothetical protein